MNYFVMFGTLLALLVSTSNGKAQTVGADVRVVTLDEAVRLAQANSPLSVSARNALRSGNASVRAALAQFLPSISASLSTTRSSGETFFQGQLIPYRGDPWSYGKGIFASMMLFDGGRQWFSYRAAQSGLDAAQALEISERYAVAQSVKIQYFAVLAALESEAAAKRQQELADRQMQLALVRISAGAAVRLDSIRSAIQVVNARLASLNARNALRNANASLTRLVASPVRVTAVAADTLDMASMETDSLILQRLAADGPAVRSAKATAAAAHASRLVAATSYLPSVSISYSFRNSNTSKDFTCCGGPASSSNSLSFGVSFAVFDGLRRELAMTNALATEDKASVALRDAGLAARESLEQLVSAYQTAKERAELELLNIAAAEEVLSAEQQRYAVGAAALLEVLNAQTALDSARSELVRARFLARTTKAQIETLIGRDLK